MKKLSIGASLFLAGAIVYGVTARGQSPSAGKPDPVKVDPKHYKVDFENDRVRVLRVTFGPGEKSVMHYHPAAVVVDLTDGMIFDTFPDGKTQDSPGKAGQVSWGAPGTHLPQNVGDKKHEAILVELKK